MADMHGTAEKPNPKFVNLTPTPKILKLLGDIEFQPWQCVAELIDNGFDEFLRIKRSGLNWNEPFEVAIALPSPQTPADQAAIVVRDNGRGMTLDQVTDAARAGWTSNDPLNNLGLFGMGFNIATARLGSVARILTTRSTDSVWVGIEVDLDRLGPDFSAPVIYRPKDSRDEHGTRIEIGALNQRADWLRRSQNQRKLRETLGKVYSYLLESEGFQLLIKDVPVKPIKHCVWDASRHVVRAGEEVPAVIPIDHPLTSRSVCLVCGLWQDSPDSSCESCGSDRLEVRERRVWGWIGIQRYLDTSEFGIDFLRNGRKILTADKTLFEWVNPDDPGDRVNEYPIELPHQGGRIVGEIHLDHVPVHYTKDAFDRADKSWIDAVRIIRGDRPLLPEKAKRFGGENRSPLARLHKGYRRADPGYNYLVPGNGTSAIHETARQWGQKFRDGIADYQTDQKWWEAVVKHEELKAQAKKEKDDRERTKAQYEADPTEEFRQPPPDAQKLTTSPFANGTGDAIEKPRTERDRLESLLERAKALPELDGEFIATGVAGRPVKLTSYMVPGPLQSEGKVTPVSLMPVAGGFAVFVDQTHRHFLEFDDDPADLVMMELANHLIARARGDAPPISAVFADLKQRYLMSRTIDVSKLAPLAVQCMRDLKERMVGCITENPERPWQNVLNDVERSITAEKLATTGITDIDTAVMNGYYLRLVPEVVVPRIIEEWPEAFFDGKLFRLPYQDIAPGSGSARRQIVAAISGYVNDVAWLAQTPDDGVRERLIRARLSLQLIADEFAPVEE